jgi:hypothetical protein
MPANPTYTYTGQPATDSKDAVRFTLADMNRDGLGWMLTDEEILWTLTQEGNNVYRAAARCADTIAAQHAGNRDVSQKRIGDLQIMYARQQGAMKDWFDIARAMRRLANRAIMPYAGGLSKTEANADRLDPDLVQGAFHRGMHDSRKVPAQEGGPLASTQRWST